MFKRSIDIRILGLVLLLIALVSVFFLRKAFAVNLWMVRTSAGTTLWRAIGSSADGTKLVVVPQNGYIRVSSNSGESFTSVQAVGSRAWSTVVSSADGTKSVAFVNGGYAWNSTDSGATWTEQTGSGSRTWTGAGMSTDGLKIVAVANSGYIYTSTDGGVNWTEHTELGTQPWYSVASDATGTNLVAGLYSGGIYTSNDSGATWNLQADAGTGVWRSIAMSSDGQKIVAGDNGGYIHTSTNGGVNWTTQASPGYTQKWEVLASSSDGVNLVAVSYNAGNTGSLFRSSDSGVTWVIDNDLGSSPGIYSMAISSDASKIIVGKYNSYMYSYGPAVAPTVTTESSGTPKEKSAILNGVLDSGYQTTVRGFQIGTSESYGTTISETGTFSIGDFSAIAVDLTCNTLYHYRAYATNATGTTYGSDSTFTTTACTTPATVHRSVMYGSDDRDGRDMYAYKLNRSGLGSTSNLPNDTNFSVSDIVVHPVTHVMYGSVSANDEDLPNVLISINKETGVGTSLGVFTDAGLSTVSISDMSFNSNNVLYAISSDGNLYTIDISSCDGSTCSVALVVSVGQDGTIAFDDEDNLFLFSDDNTYYVIDVTNGGLLVTRNFSNPSGNSYAIRGAIFDEENNLYVSITSGGGATAYLATIDINTATITTPSSSSYLRFNSGLAFDYVDIEAPTLSTDSTSGITKTTATLAGNLLTSLGAVSTEIGFEYGTTDSYGSTNLTSGTFAGVLEPLFSVGTLGTGNGQFYDSYGVAVDSDDNVYITDYTNSRVQKFDSSGVYVSSFGTVGSGNGQFQAPFGIAIDRLDNIYVVDGSNSRVQKFDASGNYLLQFGTSGDGTLSSPNGGIETDGFGNVYVVDSGNNRVVKYDSDGNYILDFGSLGTDPGQFNGIYGVGVDADNNVYTVDQANAVQKFTSEGVYVSKFGTPNTETGEDGGFSSPSDIDFDSDGNIYVVDASNANAQKFTSGGVFIRQFAISPTRTGFEIGQLKEPYGIAIDSEDNVYIVDNSNAKLTKFSKSVSFTASLSNLTCGTIYHYRAYANNGVAGYSAGQTFTTESCPSAGHPIAPPPPPPVTPPVTTPEPVVPTPEPVTPVVEKTPTIKVENPVVEVVVEPTLNTNISTNEGVVTTPASTPATSVSVSGAGSNGVSIFINSVFNSSTISHAVESVLGKDTVLGITETKKATKAIIETPVGQTVTEIVPAVGAASGVAVSVAAGMFANPLTMSEIFLIPMRLWALLMTALGLKKRNRPWGTVYDSVTKQPLDPAYVVLYDNMGKEVATSITDIDGRYGFLIGPGTYHLIASKTNYSFPSIKLKGQNIDELYNDLYFGTDVTITTEGDVIGKNIPLDANGFDWNEYTKKEHKLTKFYSNRQKVIAYVSNILFYIGLLVTITAVLVVPTGYNIGTLCLYLLLFILKRTILRPKPQGMVTSKKTSTPIPFAIVRIYSASTNREILHKVTDKVGKYYCLIPNGTYYATVEVKNPDSTYTKVYTSEQVEVTGGYFKGKFLI